jgi:small glutamine-rich tetratricopeptide repeat-containing protein alpha
MDNSNPVFFSNRANVFIALEQFSKAIEDAESAITANPQFTKAYLRKALALFEMPHVEGSV